MRIYAENVLEEKYDRLMYGGFKWKNFVFEPAVKPLI